MLKFQRRQLPLIKLLTQLQQKLILLLHQQQIQMLRLRKRSKLKLKQFSRKFKRKKMQRVTKKMQEQQKLQRMLIHLLQQLKKLFPSMTGRRVSKISQTKMKLIKLQLLQNRKPHLRKTPLKKDLMNIPRLKDSQNLRFGLPTCHNQFLIQSELELKLFTQLILTRTVTDEISSHKQ